MPSVITWTIVPPMPQGPNVILLGLVIQKPMPTPYPLRHIPSLRGLGLSGSATDITSFPTFRGWDGPEATGPFWKHNEIRRLIEVA